MAKEIKAQAVYYRQDYTRRGGAWRITRYFKVLNGKFTCVNVTQNKITQLTTFGGLPHGFVKRVTKAQFDKALRAVQKKFNSLRD